MVNGIIVINKEKGYTSHDVVARLRGILHTRKIGHTGTLDPMATGVLPVCVGGATKLCEMLTDHDKEYEAVMILGRTYDTLDVTGELTGICDVTSTESDIEDAAAFFTGGYDQVPPMYSARKVDGKKLYDLARKGITIERRPVFVSISEIKILSIDLPRVRFSVKCGKGTYIRSLIDDMGKRLGCGAAMEELMRTRSGDFTIGGSYSLSEVEEAVKSDKISDVIISLDEFFGDLPRLDATGRIQKLVSNGNVIPGRDVRTADTLPAESGNGARIRVYDNGRLCGIYEYMTADDVFRPFRMFPDRDAT